MKSTRAAQLLLLGLLLAACLPAVAQQRPNIVLIISDDQAWTDYGFMGHPAIQTPHLDALARRSLVFDRGYVAAPLCRPSLASMATGLYPFQHGITGNDVDGYDNRAALDLPLRDAFHQHPNLIKSLASHGYLTHQSGKWWEGSFQDGGFTHGMTHGDPDRGGRHGDAGLKIGREGLQQVTDFIDLAVSRKKPFFLWYAPFLPHTPHNPPQRLLDKVTQPDRAADVTRYFAMCQWFDETCGELLGYLDGQGISDNTVVLYICDNGWAASSTNTTDPHQKLWKNYAQRSKGSPYENGIRTPIMVSWPAQVEPARAESLAHAIDLFPTIAAAAGIPTPNNLPGIDLRNEEARNRRERVFGVCHSTHNMTIGNPDETQQYLWCVENEWKLIIRSHGQDTTRYRNLHQWDTAPVHLFNLQTDPHEETDLANERPDVVARLRQAVAEWRKQTGPKYRDKSPRQPDRKVVYKQTPQANLQLHLFLPQNHQASDQRPGIVFFFGGGWNSGQPSQLYPHCEHLASRGMVAMAAEYRVKQRHHTTPRECVQDGKSAIRWIRQHARDWGIDPDRILAAGGSAGGHVAAACGTVAGFHEEGENQNVSERPAALVLFNPVFDNGPSGYGHDRVQEYWRPFSPLHNIHTDTPPTLVLLGTADELIPVETAKKYQQMMAAAGARCDLRLYTGQPHGFFNLKNSNYYQSTVRDMDQFLTSLGYLQDNEEQETVTNQ